jgi:hypothetical protein
MQDEIKEDEMPEYTEPVLQPLGKLRDLTFKSGEKTAPEKYPGEKNSREKSSFEKGHEHW